MDEQETKDRGWGTLPEPFVQPNDEEEWGGKRTQEEWDAPFLVPGEDIFINEQGETVDFIRSAELLEVVNAQRQRFPEFSDLANVRFLAYWQRKASKKEGKTALGTCRKLAGLLFAEIGVHYAISLPADIFRQGGTHYHVHATIFHELCHVFLDEDKDGEAKPKLVGHDFTGFNAEIRRFGSWRADLGKANDAFVARKKQEDERQSEMFGGIHG